MPTARLPRRTAVAFAVCDSALVTAALGADAVPEGAVFITGGALELPLAADERIGTAHARRPAAGMADGRQSQDPPGSRRDRQRAAPETPQKLAARYVCCCVFCQFIELVEHDSSPLRTGKPMSMHLLHSAAWIS